MMINENVSLKPYNTFGIDVKAAFFTAYSSVDQLLTLLANEHYSKLPHLVLGGGSNILFTKDFDGIVLRNQISGIEIINEDADHWYVKAGAGTSWHGFVTWCIDRGFAGAENLSLIPGNVGAAPIQNIGAYGAEQKDIFYELEAADIVGRQLLRFNNNECRFGYRDSIFKREYKGKLVITSVTYALNKKPAYNVSYGAIEQELRKMGIADLSVKAISEAVCNIRRSKLPDPSIIGNAGSFFKNPEIDQATFSVFKSSFPNAVAYALPDGNFKLAAGWLIEQCGWKGKRVGNTGSHKDQALVLVNYGDASGEEILNLALAIQDSVRKKFGIVIEAEVNVI